MSEGEATGRLPRWLVAIPIIAAALCLVALLPWLLYAPTNPPASYVAGRAVGTVALVAYPVLLAGLILVSVWLRQRGVAIEQMRLARRLFWLLFLAFVVSVSISLLLMLKA